MDNERQIRFLYPPLLLMAFVAWAIYLDVNRSVSDYLSPAPSKAFVVATSNLNASASSLFNMSSQLLAVTTNSLRIVPSSGFESNTIPIIGHLITLTSNSAELSGRCASMSSDLATLTTNLAGFESGNVLSNESILTTIAAAGALVLVLGWVIGAIALLPLRIVFLVINWRSKNYHGPHDTFFSQAAIIRITARVLGRNAAKAQLRKR